MAAIEEFRPQMRVSYAPNNKTPNNKKGEREHGTVSSVNSRWVFVRFDEQVARFGWDGTTSKPCNPNDLKING